MSKRGTWEVGVETIQDFRFTLVSRSTCMRARISCKRCVVASHRLLRWPTASFRDSFRVRSFIKEVAWTAGRALTWLLTLLPSFPAFKLSSISSSLSMSSTVCCVVDGGVFRWFLPRSITLSRRCSAYFRRFSSCWCGCSSTDACQRLSSLLRGVRTAANGTVSGVVGGGNGYVRTSGTMMGGAVERVNGLTALHVRCSFCSLRTAMAKTAAVVGQKKWLSTTCSEGSGKWMGQK